jgi:ABC-type cobalamin/Fe3+-siderophores transport system ATPase subunit
MGIERLIVSLAHDQRLTCVLVTHDRDQGRRMCQTVILLEAGHLVRSGTAAEVLGA